MYSKAIVILLSLITVSLVSCFDESNKDFDEDFVEGIETYKATRCLSDQSFGYILLAIQWAPSFCNSTACGDRNRNGWTIHGAWPQHTNNSWPQDCCFESTFDLTKIKALEPELLQKWPSLKASGTHEAFWKHEWTKHGTCAMNSERLKGHFNYFNTTLRLFDSFPLQSWLQSSNIIPSNSSAYQLAAIHSVVEPRLGAKVELECLNKQPYPLLQHIYVCLDKNTLKPINCTRSDDKQCGNNLVRIPLK